MTKPSRQGPVALTLTELRDGKRAVLTVEEAGAVMCIARTAAYDAVRRGELPSVRLGRRVFVPVPALLSLLNTGAHTGDQSTPPSVSALDRPQTDDVRRGDSQ